MLNSTSSSKDIYGLVYDKALKEYPQSDIIIWLKEINKELE